jgi:hypothetical protein
MRLFNRLNCHFNPMQEFISASRKSYWELEALNRPTKKFLFFTANWADFSVICSSDPRVSEHARIELSTAGLPVANHHWATSHLQKRRKAPV